MSEFDWSLFTFNERTGRGPEARYDTESRFLDAAETSLMRADREWFVSARSPIGMVLTVEDVRGMIDARIGNSRHYFPR